MIPFEIGYLLILTAAVSGYAFIVWLIDEGWARLGVSHRLRQILLYCTNLARHAILRMNRHQ